MKICCTVCFLYSGRLDKENVCSDYRWWNIRPQVIFKRGCRYKDANWCPTLVAAWWAYCHKSCFFPRKDPPCLWLADPEILMIILFRWDHDEIKVNVQCLSWNTRESVQARFSRRKKSVCLPGKLHLMICCICSDSVCFWVLQTNHKKNISHNQSYNHNQCLTQTCNS